MNKAIQKLQDRSEAWIVTACVRMIALIRRIHTTGSYDVYLDAR